MDEIQAAVLRMKLPFLNKWNQRRREIAIAYNQAFEGLPVALPSFNGEEYVAHLYVLRTKDREGFRRYLGQHGIATDIHYPIPDHMQPAYSGETGDETLDVTETACETVVSIPCFRGFASRYLSCAPRTVMSLSGLPSTMRMSA